MQFKFLAINRFSKTTLVTLNSKLSNCEIRGLPVFDPACHSTVGKLGKFVWHGIQQQIPSVMDIVIHIAPCQKINGLPQFQTTHFNIHKQTM